MSDPRLSDMSFRDYLTNALMRLGDAEAAYNQLVAGDDDARDQLTNLLADAAIAISLGSSKALDDAVALSRATRGEVDPDQVGDADMWAAITADVESGFGLEDTHEIDAEREARFLASIGDVLAPPAFGDVEVPGSLWSETAAVEDKQQLFDRDTYRSDHPFPLDTDGEGF